MKNLDQSITKSLDCDDISILPHLPYILQDFWEMGSYAEPIITMIKKHTTDYSNLKLLDLGCGKGAVTINIARKLKCNCRGIDAVREFIEVAEQKAQEFGVDNLCSFEQGDIREWVKSAAKFNVIILGSIGPIFGKISETIAQLKNCLEENGIIIIDEGYILNIPDGESSPFEFKTDIIEEVKREGVSLFDEIIHKNEEEVFDEYDNELIKLSQRCDELAELYPDKAECFENYKKKQSAEYDTLKTDFISSTMVFKKD